MDFTRRTCLKGLLTGAALGSAGGLFSGEDGGGAARFVRYERGGRRAYGRLDGERVRELRGAPFEGVAETGEAIPLAEVKLLAPSEPSKVLALAGNYRSHLTTTPVPAHPEAFLKPPSAVLDPEGTIVIPEGSREVHYEGELVVVIGKTARKVPRAEALSHVFGYTCGNDVSERDWQKGDRQWWRAKGADTFGPFGPWIVRGIDPGDLLLTTRLNGVERQKARTSELIFAVEATVSFLSQSMTLLPGDLIYTGTPGQTSAMKPGDVVEVEIEKIGVLKNRVG